MTKSFKRCSMRVPTLRLVLDSARGASGSPVVRNQCAQLLRACAGDDAAETQGGSKRKARKAMGVPRPKRRRVKQKHRAQRG